ncbi:MAG: thiamine pyrophosphate-dependent enzyme, partial [Pseudomonadota bacterium]|nr:thiamine pyrophosphate-dependent enzyme [Pseudomonadota bacterium]
MQLIRTFDKKAVNLQRTGQLGTYASCLGAEAIATAGGMALAREDYFVPYYRDHATQYLRGVPLYQILQYWGGDERG